MGAFALRIDGGWVELDCPATNLPVKSSRPRGGFTTLGGNVFEQFARRATRTWRFEYGTWDSHEDIRHLAYAADATDVWLLDVSAAQANMLDARAVVGVFGAATIAVDGVPMPTLGAGAVATSLVRNGQTYILSGFTSAAATTTIATYNIGAGNVNITAPAGSGARAWTVTFAAAADAAFVYTQTTTGNTTALRLTEGATRVDALPFLAGQRTPCPVVVDDPARTLRFVASGVRPDLDAAVELREVG